MRFVALLLSFVAVSQGETPVPVVVSAASPSIGVTADSLASVYGDRLASKAESAAGPPWPLALGDIPGVRITDAAGKTQDVELLYVSPSQMNVHIPAGTDCRRAKGRRRCVRFPCRSGRWRPRSSA